MTGAGACGTLFVATKGGPPMLEAVAIAALMAVALKLELPRSF